jgi:hypothetical protein
MPICFWEVKSAEIFKASDLSVLASCTQEENPSVQIKNMRKAGICLNPSYELDSTSKGIFFNTAELRTNLHTFWNICSTKRTLYRNSHLWIPRNETAQPHSQFLYLCICEGFYIPRIGLPIWLQQNRHPILGIYESQIHKCGNQETEHYNSVSEITRSRSFISGNTSIGTTYLYWILTGLSFAVHHNTETFLNFVLTLTL